MAKQSALAHNLKRFFKPQRTRGRRVHRMPMAAGGQRIYDYTPSWPGIFQTGKSANQAIYQALNTIRNACRTAYQQSDHAKALVRTVRQGSVGDGVQLRFADLERNLEMRLQEAWREYVSKDNLTPMGNQTLTNVAGQAINSLFMSGEFVCYMGRGKYPLEVIEPSRLDHMINDDQTRTAMGVQFGMDGRPTAYHLRTRGEGVGSGTPLFWDFKETEVVSARNVLHLFVSEFPEQIRGVPLMVTAGFRFDAIHGYTKAELNAASLAAKKQLFITRNEMNEGLPALEEDEEGSPKKYLDPDDEEILQLPYGASVTNWSPDHPHGNFPEFLTKQIEGVAASGGAMAADVGGDYSKINFSAGRMARLSLQDNYRELQEILVEGLYRPLFKHFLMTEGMAVTDTAPSRILRAVRFVPRSWAHVQPREQAMANDVAIKNGTKTVSEVVREEGRDPDEHFEELRRERELMESMGFMLVENEQPKEVEAMGGGD